MIKLRFHVAAAIFYCLVVVGLAVGGSAQASESLSQFDPPHAPAAAAAASTPTASAPAPAGVGLLITLEKPTRFVVQYVLPDMPAAKANVQVGDVVLAVDGAAIDNVKSVEELVDKIRGASGSTVKLKIQSGDKTREVALVRGTIPTVKPQPADDFGREVSVYFYQTEDLIPEDPSSNGFLGHHSVGEFLRKQLIRHGTH